LTYALVTGGNAATAGVYGTIQVNSDGSYVYTLTKPYDTSPDANNGANTEENKESFTYEVTDANGNTAQGTITVDIVDDTPLISTIETSTDLTVDETFLVVNSAANFSSSFAFNFGADGAGTITYLLGTAGGASGLVDTAKGQATW
jgi:VCBS repeat-containing protein